MKKESSQKPKNKETREQSVHDGRKEKGREIDLDIKRPGSLSETDLEGARKSGRKKKA
jgi:hypothetical protein